MPSDAISRAASSRRAGVSMRNAFSSASRDVIRVRSTRGAAFPGDPVGARHPETDRRSLQPPSEPVDLADLRRVEPEILPMPEHALDKPRAHGAFLPSHETQCPAASRRAQARQGGHGNSRRLTRGVRGRLWLWDRGQARGG